MAHLEKYKLVAVHNMVGHYAREAEARGYERENIDSSRTAQNYVVGFGTRVRDEGSGPEALARRVRDGVSEAIANHEADSGKRIRKDANVLCDWVITLPRDCPQERAGEFFEAAVKFVQERYGRENVPGGFVHMDEATPHMHVPVIPVQGKRLRASKVIDRADLRSFHGDLGKAVDRALGMHVSVELPDEERGAKQLSHLEQDEYMAAKGELRRTSRDVDAARAEAQSWARLSRALGPSGTGADVPQEDGSIRHQQSVGQLVAERETMRAEAEMQLELARQARQQAERELSEARQEASQARVEAQKAREDAEAAKSAQRAAEGARAAVQRDMAALEEQREDTKRLVTEEYQRHLQAKAANLVSEARAATAEQEPTVSLDDAEAAFSSFSRFVASWAIDLWETVRDGARALWRSWRHGGWGTDVAGRLGIGEMAAGRLADGALDAAAEERGAWAAASDLEFGGAEKVASRVR